MFTLLKTLHVLLAIFLIGPLTMIPMTALRSIRRRDASAVQGAARQTMFYALGSLLVFGLGFAVVAVRSTEFSMGDPWITISMTLYIIALVLVLAVLVPDLRRASRLLTDGVVDAPAAAEPANAETDTPATEPTLTATATELAGKQRLDGVYGRSAAVSGLVTLLFVAIVVLMVVRPFS